MTDDPVDATETLDHRQELHNSKCPGKAVINFPSAAYIYTQYTAEQTVTGRGLGWNWKRGSNSQGKDSVAKRCGQSLP